MKHAIIAIILLGLLINCKQTNQSITSSENQINSLNSAITDNVNESIEFLKEFYIKYYGKYRDRKGIENYISDRILKRMDSLTNGDNLILEYDPFIQGQDWDTNALRKSIEINPLKNKDEYRVRFLLFEDREITTIDVLLRKNKKGKFLIYSLLNDDYLNFKKENSKAIQKDILKDWVGIYEGTFLRLKDESADPRGWATITLKISESEIVFDLFSYVEENKFQLNVVEQKKDSIILTNSNDTIKQNRVFLSKKNNKYTLESSYIDSLLSIKESIKMKKIKK